MRKGKDQNIVMGVLITLVLIMGVLVILSINGTISLSESDNNTNYYSSISGVYSALEKLNIDGEDKDISFTLYLLENGTFKYEYSTYAPVGVIGNYIIDDNTIILNYMFNTNSGTDLEVTDGTKKLTITDDKKIIDSDYKYKDNNKDIDSIKLSYEESINSDFNINNILKSGLVSENDNININSSSQEKNNQIIEKYLGKWLLGFNAKDSYSNINIKKNKNSETGYTIDVLVNKEADYKNLDLYCADNSGVCYATANETHHFSIIISNETVTIIPDYSTQGTIWEFGTRK